MSITDTEYRDALLRTGEGMQKTLLAFVDELRLVGVPVSISEVLDALSSLSHIPLSDRTAFKASLGATMVKNAAHYAAFDAAFEIFFAIKPFESVEGSQTDELEESMKEDSDLSDFLQSGEQPGPGGGAGDTDVQALLESIFEALLNDNESEIRSGARQAVTVFASMEPGRPVGGTYYLYRTLRGVHVENLARRLREAGRKEHVGGGDGDAAKPGDGISALEERLLREDVDRRLEKFKSEVKDEIRRRLVDDRGAEAVAKTTRKPLLEEVDFMHATSVEMAELRSMINPLARRLQARLAMRRRHRNRGRLDVRKTMRESLSSGGVPLYPRYKHPRPSKPELWIVCDISGSVASFARFTLQFIYAIQLQFSKVRSFVFIDEVDEVTDFFKTDDLGKALQRINNEANVVWIDGHSDYGNAFTRFYQRYGDQVTKKSSVIITGDARNNYHSSEAEVIAELADHSRHLFWLNPEPTAYWDTGDSIVSEYGTHCEGVHEVRNLKQLEVFVESLVDH